jgi:branched-chain amino acid transport system substrate-binding protein
MRMNERKRVTWSVCLGVAAAVLLAACSSSSSTGTQAGAARTFTGQPVTFTFIGDDTPPPGSPPIVPLATVKATVAAINAAGGINGHKLDMVICDTQSSAAVAETCASQAVARKTPAVVSFTGEGSAIVPILQSAHIPDIDAAISPVELTSPVSFTIGPSASGLAYGLGTIAVREKCKKLAFIGVLPSAYVAVAEAAYGDVKTVVSGHGVTLLPAIQAVPGSPDFSSNIDTAQSEGADCIAYQAIDNADAVAIIKSARSIGYKGKLITAVSEYTAAGLSSLGSEANGVFADGSIWPASQTSGHKGAAEFTEQMRKFGGLGTTTLGQNEAVWMEIRLFAAVASEVKTVTAASILGALNGLHGYQTGLTPPISYNIKAPDPALGARIFLPDIVLGDFQNGAFVPSGGFVDIATGASVPFS